MLKKIVVLVIILVAIGPIYDYMKQWIPFDFNQNEQFMQQQSDVITNEDERQEISVKIEPTEEVEKPKLPKAITNEEQLADAFYYYFSSFSTEFTINYKGSTEQIDSLLQNAVEQALAKDTYVMGHLSERQMTYEYNKRSAKISVAQTYLTNLQQEQVVDAKIASIIEPLKLQNMSDLEKVIFVNDYIVKNTVYGEKTTTSAHSAFTLVNEGQAVCQGYALFATKLLMAMGVQSIYVVGDVYTGPHAWNLVQVDGEWYHLDTTWNDPLPDRGDSVRYKYLLQSDRQMAKDHTWIVENYPKATAENYAYMQNIMDAVVYGDYLYYSNEEKDGQLYRMNLLSNESEKLSSTRAFYLATDGESLYFSNYSNGAYLTKANMLGQRERILLREDVKKVKVEAGYIYFETASGPKKMAIQ